MEWYAKRHQFFREKMSKKEQGKGELSKQGEKKKQAQEGIGSQPGVDPYVQLRTHPNTPGLKDKSGLGVD